jgi:hypothetical protein
LKIDCSSRQGPQQIRDDGPDSSSLSFDYSKVTASKLNTVNYVQFKMIRTTPVSNQSYGIGFSWVCNPEFFWNTLIPPSAAVASVVHESIY